MQLIIDHHTRYSYAAPVSLSVHRFFLYPRLHPDLTLRHYDLRILPQVSVQWLRDAHDNHFLQAFFPDPTDHLEIDLHLAVENAQPNPFAFLLAHEAVNFPFPYSAAEQPLLAPFLTPPPEAATLRDWWTARQPLQAGPTISLLTEWVRQFPSHFRYTVREEEGTFSPTETLARGEGSCRDLATLFTALCRSCGLAARLVTGYLYTPPENGAVEEWDQSGAATEAAAALHAWVEVYLPGGGWRGLDPTNGVFADDHYLPLAVAPSLGPTHPFQGNYFSTTPVASTIHTHLRIAASP